MDLNALMQTILQHKLQQDYRNLQKWHRLPLHRLDAAETDRAFAAQPGSRQLRITYVMNHARVCGGSKIIIEHANQLVQRGHQVFIVCPDPRPDWIEVRADFLQIPRQMRLADALPDADIIVCTVVDQVSECYLSKKAPVLMFEQGDTYIFEYETITPEEQQYFQGFWSLPVPAMAVSSGLAQALERNFSRQPRLLPNALNERVFYPRDAVQPQSERPKILFVGAEQAEFKGIADVRAALEIVRQAGWEVEPVWVTPMEPHSPFAGTLAVAPSQERLGDLYRQCDIYVSGSRFESFPLPPLEAMTCGCAVVSTRNVGFLEYGADGENCLLAEIRDPQSLADAILKLLGDRSLRERLIEGGYRTAARYRWEAVVEQLEGYLYGAIDLWHRQHAAELPRVERLPQGLTRQEALGRVQQTVSGMDEPWCLWLVEGEEIAERELAQLGRMLQEAGDDAYAVTVQYREDIAGHPIARTEPRVLKKGASLPSDWLQPQVLPVTVDGGTEAYFLPAWLGQVRRLYKGGAYGEMIPVLQNAFGTAAHAEQALVIKWIALALIENRQLEQAASLLSDALAGHAMDTDLLYLRSLVTGQLAGRGVHPELNGELSRMMQRVQELLGEARLYPEWFLQGNRKLDRV